MPHVHTRARKLVTIFQNRGGKESSKNGGQATLIPSICNSSSICNLWKKSNLLWFVVVASKVLGHAWIQQLFQVKNNFAKIIIENLRSRLFKASNEKTNARLMPSIAPSRDQMIICLIHFKCYCVTNFKVYLPEWQNLAFLCEQKTVYLTAHFEYDALSLLTPRSPWVGACLFHTSPMSQLLPVSFYF